VGPETIPITVSAKDNAGDRRDKKIKNKRNVTFSHVMGSKKM
jgi:hypothetical protein